MDDGSVTRATRDGRGVGLGGADTCDPRQPGGRRARPAPVATAPTAGSPAVTGHRVVAQFEAAYRDSLSEACRRVGKKSDAAVVAYL